MELPRNAAEVIDRQNAVATPQDGYHAGELERDVAELTMAESPLDGLTTWCRRTE